MKLQRQVVTTALSGTVLSLLLTGVGTAALLHRREAEALDATLVASAQAFARAPPGGVWVGEGAASPVQVRAAAEANEPGRRAVAREELVFADEGAFRVLYFPTEAPDAHADLAHPHGLVVAQAPALRWQDAIGPFLLTYSVAVLVVTMLIAAVQVWMLRVAFGPLDRAVSLLREISTTTTTVRMPETGPDEVAQVLREVNALLERLESATSAQSRFTARAAHELRTPVASLIGELELARRRTRSAEELTATVDRALVASRRLGGLVEALLGLARVDAGHVEAGRTRVRGSEILLRVIHELVPSGELEVSLDGDAEILAHEALLAAALSNLVRNAQVHGGGADRVGVERVGDTLRFFVEDRGPGPGSAAPGAGGLGLGLPLATEVARRHGGGCRLVPRPEGGCRAELDVAVH